MNTDKSKVEALHPPLQQTYVSSSTDLYSAMLNTAEQADIKILSDNKCCQLLAWVLNIGGHTEESTHNKRLNTDLKYAAKRLHIGGGSVPNQELVLMCKQYHRELDSFIQKKTAKPEWLCRIEKYYGLKTFNL